MTIFQMDGSSLPPDTSELRRFSVFEPNAWNRFEKTKDVRELEKLALYVPEEYHTEYSRALNDYLKKEDDDTVFIARESRKEFIFFPEEFKDYHKTDT